MDFSEFKTPEAPKRFSLTPKTQEFENIKYRKASHTEKKTGTTTIAAKFYVSDKYFKDLGLATNALRVFVNKDKTDAVVALVTEKDGKMMRQRIDKKTKAPLDKSQEFKSDPLELVLASKGLIDKDAIGDNQFLELVQIAENIPVEGVNCIKVFSVVKGYPKKVETTNETADVAASTVSTPESTGVTTASTAKIIETPVAGAVAGASEKTDWED